jgi:hypothetical protein
MSTALTIRHELAKYESRLAWLTAEVAKVQGQRDTLLREIQDLEGAHDQRPVGVR